MTPEEREKWLEERRGRLGATDISAIFEENPFKTAYEVWLEKRGMLEDWSGNASTYLGHLLEPALLDDAEKRWGKIERNVVVTSPAAPVISSTLDGRIVTSGRPVETKTAGLTNEFAELGHWGDADSGRIPSWYAIQVQTQLLCTEADIAHLLALVAGRGIVAYAIERDPAASKTIAEYSTWWWDEYVIGGKEPERKEAPPIDVIKRIRREPNSVVNLSYEDMELVEIWEQAKREAKAAEKVAAACKAQVLLTLGAHEGGLLPDGRVVEFLQRTRGGYVVADCKYRQLGIRKPKGRRR